MARSNRRPDGRVRSVFEDLHGDSSRARNLAMRSELMVLLSRFIKASGLTQHAAAEYFGTSQPRISDLLRGRIEKFSVDLLIDMTERAGWTVGLKLKKRAA